MKIYTWYYCQDREMKISLFYMTIVVVQKSANCFSHMSYAKIQLRIFGVFLDEFYELQWEIFHR